MTEPQTGKFTTRDYARWCWERLQRGEAARKAKLEARPDRLERLKCAAEKRARRGAKRLDALVLK